MGFDRADLDENRQGRLSAAQAAARTALARKQRIRALVGSLLFVTFFVVSGTLPNTRSVGKAVVIMVILESLFVFGIVKLTSHIYRKDMAQIREGKVTSLVGRLEHFQRGRYARYCYVEFAGKTLVADLDLIKPNRKQLEQQQHRIYCLGGSIVSFEPIG